MCGGRRGEGVSVAHQHQHQHIAHQQHTQRTTNKRTTHNTEHARWHRQFCLPKFAHVGLSLDPRGSPKKPLDLIHFQFENRSRTTCPRFLQSFALPGEAVQFQHGNQQPYGSISLSHSPPPSLLHHNNTQHVTHITRQRQRQNPSITNDLHVRHFP